VLEGALAGQDEAAVGGEKPNQATKLDLKTNAWGDHHASRKLALGFIMWVSRFARPCQWNALCFCPTSR